MGSEVRGCVRDDFPGGRGEGEICHSFKGPRKDFLAVRCLLSAVVSIIADRVSQPMKKENSLS